MLKLLPSPVLQALSTMIAPGGQIRLSPYVQQFQTHIISDGAINKSLFAPPQQELIPGLAVAWIQHLMDGGSPIHDIYINNGLILKAAIIDHGSLAIPQMQLILLEMLRRAILPETLAVGFVGETAWVHAAALLDFCVMVRDVCDLYSITFPFQYVHLVCTSTPDTCDIKRHLLQSFHEMLPELPVSYEWQEYLPADLPVVFVETDDVDALEKQLLQGSQNQITVPIWRIFNPEDARTFANWRLSFINRYTMFRSLGPCGAEFGNRLPSACSTCSISRREPFHSTPLYEAFQDAIKGLIEMDIMPQYLEWSYFILQNGCNEELDIPFTRPSLKLDSPTQFRYTGSVDNDLHLCPGYSTSEHLVIRYDAGKFTPRLEYGELFYLQHAEVKLAGNTTILQLTSQSQFKLESLYDDSNLSFLPDYTESTRSAVDRCGQRFFGFQHMHDFQHDILSHALTGKSILGIAATGGGKSECFILPALLMSGVTIVISPLKSLMQDQIEQRLQQRYGLGFLSTYINSDIPFWERLIRLRRMELGQYRLIYFTPEQLERSYVLESLKRANENVGIRYLALDEAHCISQWGHDFRSSYLNMMPRLQKYNIRPVRIALTATASPKVREDLCDELELRNAPPPEGDVLVVSSNRAELNLVVRVCNDSHQKTEAILNDLTNFLRQYDWLNQETGSAIVFMPHAGSSPENTWMYYTENMESEQGRYSANVTRFASYLERKLQHEVAIYHGKISDLTGSESENEPDEDGRTPLEEIPRFGWLKGRTRRGEQIAFISGQRNIMVATKGFGMGIDKPDVRLVIHRSPTANLEAYAQEAGRAGRDRQQANVILYYSPDTVDEPDDHSPSDYEIQKRFISEKYIRRQDVEKLRQFLITVNRHVGNTLYFTVDEFLRFLEPDWDNPDFFKKSIYQIQKPGDKFSTDVFSPKALVNCFDYDWPEFAPWTSPKGRFSGEHMLISIRGYYYDQIKNYISRILNVIYRIRPVMPSGKRVALLKNVQMLSIAIRPIWEEGKNGQKYKVTPQVNAEAIIQSNAPFGNLLREKGIEARELALLLGQKEIIPLAQRLNFTLRETSELISDIISAGYVRNNPRNSLLNLRLGVPIYVEDATTLSGWRNHAGAYYRANPDRSKIKNPTLDDYFPWKVVNNAIGWEVEPGIAFEDDSQFYTYLQVFMQAHDERQQNDWDSYHRLLTDYVGVTETGAIKPGLRRNCLRSAMLGYLKTNEVIEGGNCYSCNVCVPDENFARYDESLRKRAVRRIDQTIQNLLEELETYDQRLPSYDLIRQLLMRIEAEEQANRSYASYLLNWTARLLQDTPGHQAAIWLRLRGMQYGLIELTEQEILRLLNLLVSNVTVKQLVDVSALIRYFLPAEELDALLLQAQVAERSGEVETAINLWQTALDKTGVDAQKIHLNIARLTPRKEEQIYHTLQASEYIADWNEATKLLSNILRVVEWSELSPMLSSLKQPEGIIWRWLQYVPINDPDIVTALALLDVNKWSQIPSENLIDVLNRLGTKPFISDSSNILPLARQLVTDPTLNVFSNELLLVALQRGLPLLDEEVSIVTNYLATTFDGKVRQDIVLNRTTAYLIMSHLNITRLADLEFLLAYFPAKFLLEDLPLAATVLQVAAGLIEEQKIKLSYLNRSGAELRTLRNALLSEPQYQREIHLQWLKIISHDLPQQAGYIEFCLQSGYIGFAVESLHEYPLKKIIEIINQVGLPTIMKNVDDIILIYQHLRSRTEDGAAYIAAELLFAAVKMDFEVKPQVQLGIIEYIFNDPAFKPLLHDEQPGNIQIARQWITYFAPHHTEQLKHWLKYFPAQTMLEDPNTALSFLNKAASVIEIHSIDIVEHNTLFKSAFALYDELMMIPEHTESVLGIWQRIAAHSPMVIFNMQLNRIKTGLIDEEALTQLMPRLSNANLTILLKELTPYSNALKNRLLSSAVETWAMYEETRQRYGDLFSAYPEAHTIVDAHKFFNPRISAERAAAWAVLLENMRIFYGYNNNWMTPVSFVVESYVLAGLLNQAKPLIDQFPLLEVGKPRRPANEFIAAHTHKQPVSSEFVFVCRQLCQHLLNQRR